MAMLGCALVPLEGVEYSGWGSSGKKISLFIYPELVNKFKSNLVVIILRGWDPKLFIY